MKVFSGSEILAETLKQKIEAVGVEVVKKDTQLQIEFCDKYDWCKLKDEEKYISKFLLN